MLQDPKLNVDIGHPLNAAGANTDAPIHSLESGYPNRVLILRALKFNGQSLGFQMGGRIGLCLGLGLRLSCKGEKAEEENGYERKESTVHLCYYSTFPNPQIGGCFVAPSQEIREDSDKDKGPRE